jgi:hypothetical protein
MNRVRFFTRVVILVGLILTITSACVQTTSPQAAKSP